MKKRIVSCLALGSLAALSACTTVEEKREPARHTSTTMTEETHSVHAPVRSTTETSTIRAY